MADKGVTREQLLEEIYAMMDTRAEPPSDWFKPADFMEAKGLTLEQARKALYRLANDGKLVKERIGSMVYYHLP